MTATETIIGGIILAIFTGMLGLLLGGKRRVTVDEFEKHKESPNPHPILPCEVHKTKLEEMDKKLDKMDGKLDNLLER